MVFSKNERESESFNWSNFRHDKTKRRKNSLKPALLLCCFGRIDRPARNIVVELLAENTPITEEGCYTAVMRRTSISSRIIRSTQRAVHLTGALLLLAGWSVHGATPKAVFILVDGIPPIWWSLVSTPFLMKSRKTRLRARLCRRAGRRRERKPYRVGSGLQQSSHRDVGNKHRVYSNQIRSPDYRYWDIFRLVKQHNPDLSTALFSTWEDNRTKLLGQQSAGGWGR